MMPTILDRYLLREWLKILLAAWLGLPLTVMLIELTEKLDVYLVRDLTAGAIALGYVFSLPERLVVVLPAAVLFATVFSVGTMNRHSELAAAKASGASVYRLVLPVLLGSVLAAGVGFALGELAPPATRKQLEHHGELERRTQNARYNFAYRAEEGWTYAVRELHIPSRSLHDVIFEREGSGAEYPTLAVQAKQGLFSDSTGRWLLEEGRFRIVPTAQTELTFRFDSMRLASLVETPADLLVEEKKPEEMRYAELQRYVEALERSGGDGRLLRVDLALKLAVPVTCIVITIFAVSFAVSGPRTGGAFGVGLALSTAVVFLVLVQLSRTIGSGGLVPPTLAAWLPNLAFGSVGAWRFVKAPT